MSNFFFSIIIPSYNRAHIILNTISTVQRQSFTNWECIIVDDGSTDNTKEVIAQIQDERVKYIYQNNAERSAARNNGAQNAKGKYICFLDSDDEFLENHLAVLHKEITNKNEPVGLFFVHAVISQNGKEYKPEIQEISSDSTKYLLENPIIPARVCVRKNIFEKLKYREDIVIVEDQVLWTNISLYFPIFQIKEHTVIYNLHEDNSINIKNNCFKPRLDGLKKFFAQEDAKQYISKSDKQKALSDCYFGIARYYRYAGGYFKYVEFLLKSIFAKPKHPQTKAKIHMIFFPSKHDVYA